MKHRFLIPVQISFPTLILIVSIILSSLFMRAVLDLVKIIAGRNHIAIAMLTLFALVALVLIFVELRTVKRTIQFLLVFISGVIFFQLILPYPEERFHFLEAGAVGWMVMRDNGSGKWQHILLATFIGFFVGALDETFQFFIPWRVADIRDILMAAGGAFWGALAHYVTYFRTT